jgi:uncharacterized protein (DUF2267 family)
MKMDELIKMVTQKAGISTDQAKMAVDTVLKFLKEKLPAPIASQIEGAIGGGAQQDITKKLGGLLGKK